ncbi:hypothetical protein PPL_09543 [Heterostelium album PN500]|uniref:Uncharacterized protein n=1 Tax=Heterostelium pallidum (strain ATCC 26659 / Pp 5 / PN500) TaxID=670386 RepID=D3BND2_HETP5|nr:hypothetical protein PPL_09543 [Heterostelium album PN500]EFA76792.1 hypothetical protein PPL_09543 [Heterostelium album PN500]|eukprot:XP_020428924.1 hypothetical protein PPL_09543 [Heterostelium album PN500]
MKLFVSLVVLLVAISTANASCAMGQKCVKLGEQCPPSSVDPWTSCEAGSWCWFGDNPKPNAWGNCTAYAKLGEFCDGDYWSCADGLTCYGSTRQPKTCQYTNYANVGEDCDSAVDCTNGNQCIYGKCQVKASTQTVGQCAGRWTDCPFGFSCNMTSNIKGSGAACATQIPSFGLDGAFPSLECDVSQSLLCLRDNNAKLTCQTPPALTTVDSNTGTCTVSTRLGADCSKAINDLVKCTIDNKCQIYASGTTSYKSCIYQNCRDIMCQNKCDPILTNDKSCTAYQYTGCYANNDSSFVRPTIFLVVIALVALLF